MVVVRTVAVATVRLRKDLRGRSGTFARIWWVAVVVLVAVLCVIPAAALLTSSGARASVAAARPTPEGGPGSAGCSAGGACLPASDTTPGSGQPSPDGYDLGRTVAWSQVASPPTGFGSGGGLVANSSSGTAISFGGINGGVLTNTTFAYSEAANIWSPVATSPAPSPRTDFSFAVDSATGTAVLFGGTTNLTTHAVSNQTWTYNLASAQWTAVVGGPAPAAREAAAFAIVPTLGVGLLYGGWNLNYSERGSLTYSDLWEFNLSTGSWTNVTVAGPRPPALEGAAMVWDPTTGRVEMFGGCYPCSASVWELDPVALTWSENPPAAGPPAGRAAASWAYDPTLSADLLFGGTNGQTTFGDTLLYFPMNNTWVPQGLPPSPGARSNAGSAFLDTPNNQTLLVAGGESGATSFTDLWRLSTTANVSLRVVNASSPTSPLAGAEVFFGGSNAGSTDVAGDLNLSQVGVVGTPLNVTDVPWYFPSNQTVWLAPGAPATLTVELTPEPLGTVHAQVNASTGGGLVGANANLSIDAVQVNPVPAVTNATGAASFFGVPPGFANVTTELSEWRPANGTATELPGGVLNVTVEVFPDPIVTVTTLGRLPGGLTPALGSVAVYLNSEELGVSSTSGVVSNATSVFGPALLVAEVVGFLPVSQAITVPFTGYVNATLYLTSEPYGLLAVTVLRVNDLLPIGGAIVSASTVTRLPFGTYKQNNDTDEAGTASLSLPEGRYFIGASAVGYLSSPNVVVNVVPQSNNPIVITLHVIPPGNITFIVRDAITHRPIRGANVTDPPVINGNTDPQGYYYATNLPPARYDVEVFAPLYFANTTSITLLSAANDTLYVNLTPAPILTRSGGWGFNLFPGDLAQLWPFLLLPLLLIVGAFVFAAALRGHREEETARPPPETSDRPEVRDALQSPSVGRPREPPSAAAGGTRRSP